MRGDEAVRLRAPEAETLAPRETRSASPAAANGLPRLVQQAGALAQTHRGLLAVLLAYVAAAVFLPTLVPVPISDDWIYTRAVETVFAEHTLRVLPIGAPAIVFQAAWGSLFASVFGLSFGVLRVSTVVLTLLSAPALYGLCRELGVDRTRSTLGTAVYLFNPLGYVLAFTFMSDPHFTALLVISSYCYVRGLGHDRISAPAVLAGSGVAALAFLVRQHGLLIPLAVLGYLLVARRLRFDREGAVTLLRVAGAPVLVAGLHLLWFSATHEEFGGQALLVDSIVQAGVSGSWLLVRRLTFIGLMYVGLFALPLAAAAAPRLLRLLRSLPPLGWLGFISGGGVIVVGLVFFARDGRRMPYIPHFLSRAGLGPNDLIVGRPPMAGDLGFDLLTAVSAAAALILLLVLFRAVARERLRGAAGIVLTLGLVQAFGVLLPSYVFRDWTIAGLSAPSLDRYLLPLVPFTVCLGLWALRDVRVSLPAAWLVTAALAAFAVMGTRDALVYQDATWDLAREANSLGVVNTRLDGGAAWDGYHLYETYDPEGPIRSPLPNWWFGYWARATDASYVVSDGPPPPGFEVVLQRPYSAWLQRQHTFLYLLRRPGVPGPP